MGKRVIKVILLLTFLMGINILSVQAQVNGMRQGADERPSILLPPWERTAKDVRNSIMRGTIISSAQVAIIDEENGNIGIYIQTLAHKECDRILHKAILDRWDAEKEFWYTVDSYTFEETKEDYPNERFSSLTTAFSVLKQPTGFYYRIRGNHSVMLGGDTESFSTRTDGILITK